MAKYILKRIGYMALVLLVVVTITFFLLHAIPGDPLTAMVEDLPEETRQAYMRTYGFDRPVLEQYLMYMKQLFTGDLGQSLRYPGRKVVEIVANYSPVSALVGGIALVVGVALGLGCGVLAALHHDRWPDRAVMILALLGTTIPTFVIASMLQYTLTVTWPIFPTTGYNGARYLVLPVLCMCVGPLATYARYMRSSMLDVVDQDYILTAEAKGLSRGRIVFRHMLRNALLPCITMICVSVAGIFSGSFIVESVFSLPGLGRYFISAINDRDYFVVLGLNVALTGIYVCSILVSDILLMLLDPRIRTQGKGEMA
ncbi:MAG: ABC transporter permease [Oscillibacter sp.]|nr:ABC transporter permease [Oscillibacter sp.]